MTTTPCWSARRWSRWPRRSVRRCRLSPSLLARRADRHVRIVLAIELADGVWWRRIHSGSNSSRRRSPAAWTSWLVGREHGASVREPWERAIPGRLGRRGDHRRAWPLIVRSHPADRRGQPRPCRRSARSSLASSATTARAGVVVAIRVCRWRPRRDQRVSDFFLFGPCMFEPRPGFDRSFRRLRGRSRARSGSGRLITLTGVSAAAPSITAPVRGPRRGAGAAGPGHRRPVRLRVREFGVAGRGSGPRWVMFAALATPSPSR